MSGLAEAAGGTAAASRRTIWTIGGVTASGLFLNGVAGLLLPLYFAHLGISPAGIGTLIAVYYLAMVPTEAAWGLLFDRYGPRWLLAGACLGAGLAMAALLLPLELAGLYLLQVVRPGLDVAPSPAGRAALASAATSRRRGFALGAYYTALSGASALGAFVGGWGTDHMGFPGTIGLVVLLRLVVAGLCVLVLPGSLPSAAVEGAGPDAGPPAGFHWQRVVALAAISLFWYVGWGVWGSFLSLFGVEVVGLSPTAIGSMVLIASLLPMLLMVPGGWLADAWGRRGMVLAGLLAVSGGLLAVSLAGDITTLTAAMVVFGLGRSCFSPALTALVADATPRRHRGRAMGLLGAGENVGVMLGPVVVGFLWQAVGPRPAIAAAAGLCAIGLPVALRLLRGRGAEPAAARR